MSESTSVTLTRAQQMAWDAVAAGGCVSVSAPPRSGKTTLALEIARSLSRPGPSSADPLILVPTRARRELLEATPQRLQLRRPHPILTPAALAFDIINTWRTNRAAPLAPAALRTGADEEAAIARLVAQTPNPPVPEDALETPALLTQVRNLCARCGDYGIGPEQLRQWGRELGISAWEWGADILANYHADDGLIDAARCQDDACTILSRWDRDAAECGVGVARPRYPLVIVDDIHDMTGASVRLLEQLRRQGSQLLVLSSPTVCVDVHRGALANAAKDLVDLCDRRESWTRLTWAPEQCAPVYQPPRHPEVAVYASQYDHDAAIASTLQRRHLYDGVDYADMAVIVRQGGMIDQLAYALRLGGVSVDARARRIAPMRQPLTRALVELIGGAARVRRGGEVGEVDEETREAVRAVVGSLFVALDDLDIVRLARRVRADVGEDGAAGALPGIDDLLDLLGREEQADAFARRLREDNDPLADAADKLARAAMLLAVAERAAIRDPLEGLGTVWAATGLELRWREAALAGSGEAHDHLDDALALFRHADFWSQRHLGARLAEYVAYVRDLNVPLDTVAVDAQRVGGVALLTPSQAAGRSFDTVVIAGVNEDVWPNLAQRDSLMRAGTLVDLASGRLDVAHGASVDIAAASRATETDERRMLEMALTRARERTIMTGIDSRDQAPSRYLLSAWAHTDEGRAERDRGAFVPPLSHPEPALTSRGLATELRRQLLANQRLVDALTLLAASGEEAAIPRTWTGLAGTPAERATWHTSTQRVWPEERTVSVSPSSVQKLLDCPLNWFLTRQGGQKPSDISRGKGLIIHYLAEIYTESMTCAEMLAIAEEQWRDLKAGTGYEATREKNRLMTRVRSLYQFLSTRHAPADVEKPVRARIAGDAHAVVNAKIDRIEHGDDGEHIFDFKTGQTATNAAAKSDPQLAVYQYALEAETGVAPTGATLVYPTAEDVKDPTMRAQRSLADAVPTQAKLPADMPDDLREALHAPGGMRLLAEYYLATAAQRARDNATDATPGAACRICPVASSCPAKPQGERTLP
ncbi:PD-(D/E)XK nuclease family protein [Nanchangia anserum]|uniref:PD-(D/E)XK nuclease family protein n=1 Tax=Nanchangia anserum TaxID=2692125 RepID=A0A8I0GDJ5_9ACTO|nr:PD-(D/E)XK nuclease family protein [Nanchangia anserum]MBD3690175.1 PD-(D/E)XK nuclease family protein [Nanchangia anserum]QOX82370.1 PD-(D/E)XK nuclease family protein [Nanchangia anserum]